MTTPGNPSDAGPAKDVVWDIGIRRDDYRPEIVDRRDALADAARDGDWVRVLDAIEYDSNWINAPRLESTSGYAPLHQAA